MPPVSRTAGRLLAGFALHARLGIEERQVDPEEIVRLALETNLTAYDASHLWLARQPGAELVTLDKKLALAMSAR